MLFAWAEDQPVLLKIAGSPLFYLACFTSADNLRAMHLHLDAPFEKIKQIEDGLEFLSSFDDHPNVIVIVDPYFTPEGRVRFVQVEREAPN